MHFKIILIFMLFLYSCETKNINISDRDIISPDISFSNRGFALVFNEGLKKKKIINRKIDNRSLIVFQRNLKKNTNVKITNLLNNKSILAKVGGNSRYPNFYNTVISKRIYQELELDENEPYIEIVAISNNSTFFAKKTKTYEEEKEVADKAPVEGISISDLSKNKKTPVKSIFQMIPTKGELLFSGKNLSKLKSFHISRLGAGLVPEGRRIFGQLSVKENLIAASREGRWNVEEINNLFPKLKERSGQVASSLSGGEQQMLAIARALMTNPRLLILDEATEGLAPIIRQEIWSAIKTLRSDTGLAILIIDKSIKELRQICDRVVILEKGRTVWRGNIDQLSNEITQEFIGV